MIEQELQSVSSYQKKETQESESPKNHNYTQDLEKQINDQMQTADSDIRTSIASSKKSLEQNKLINQNTFSHQNNQEIDEDIILKNNRYFGNNFVCCFIKQEPLFTLGPHWPMFLCTFTLLGIAGFALIQFVAIKKGKVLYYGEIIVTSLLLLFYLLTAIKNPGIYTAKKYSDQKNNQIGFCQICRVKMNQDIYHCYDCDVCIKGYDHHCPWTGKCIGDGNLLFFKFFIFFLCFFFIFSMVVAVARVG